MTYGSEVIAFYTPTVSGGGGPGGGQNNSTMVVSASSTPTLKSGVTVSGGTGIFDDNLYLNATVSGGSNVSLSQYTGGSGPGPGPGK
jgi:hypothetical protein